MRKKSLRRLLAYAGRHGALLSVACVCMAVVGLATAAYAYLMGPVLRFLVSGAKDGIASAMGFLPPLVRMRGTDARWLLPLLIVGIGAIKGLAYLGQFYAMGLFGQRIAADLRRDLFARLCRLSPVQLSKSLSGDLLS